MNLKIKLTILFQNLKKYWELFLFLLATYCSIEVPLWILFRFPLTGILFYLEISISIIFFISLILSFKTSYYKNGNLITDKKTIFINYLRSWFVLDTLSIFPFEILFEMNLIPEELTFLSIFRFLRIIKLIDIDNFKLSWGMHEFSNTSFLRLFFLIYWIALFAHWTACGWIRIGGGEQNVEATRKYIRAIYWSITTLGTIGYGDITPVTNEQTLYAVSVMIIGAGVYGYLVGNIASILSNRDLVKTQFIEKMQKITTFMTYKNLPKDLQTNIFAYYDYVWKNRKGFDENLILAELPPSVRERVGLYLNKPLVKKVPFLADASEDLISKIVLNLRPIVYMEGDYIFRKGDEGDNLYFISKGIVEIVSEDGITIYGTLTDGSFFGEIALIKDSPRTASIRAKVFCDLYYIDKTTFKILVKGYPKFEAHINELVEERMKRLKH